jgi:hypothetical protein
VPTKERWLRVVLEGDGRIVHDAVWGRRFKL